MILYMVDPQAHSSHFLAILNIIQSPGWTVFSLLAKGSILFSSISYLHLNKYLPDVSQAKQFLFVCVYSMSLLNVLLLLYLGRRPPVLNGFAGSAF